MVGVNTKEPHEQGVCERFLAVYNNANGTSYAFVGSQAPPAPDCLCSNDLNIEVVTAYYNETAAKQLHDAAKGKAKPDQMGSWMPDADQKISDVIDQCIKDKAEKDYSYKGKLWLVIDIRAQLAEWEEDIEGAYLNGPRALPAGKFDEIWLVMGDWAGDHIGKVTLK